MNGIRIPSEANSGAPALRGLGFRQATKGYCWSVQGNVLQPSPQASRRPFKWSFFLARALSRLNAMNF